MLTYLLCQLVHLLGCQTSVGEHADLRGDVAPVVLAAELLEVLLEKGTHGDDAVSHALDLTEPLLVERSVVQNLRGDAGTVNWGVGVQWANEYLDLRVNTLLLVGRLADDREGTDTLAVETHVLGKGLGQDWTKTLLDEVAESKGILGRVTTGEALVSHVEEGEVVASLDSLSNLHPLLLGGVYTSRVVGTSVEQDNAVLGHGLDIGYHSVKVETNRVLVVVAVLLDLEARVLEDSVVVGP
jgi:hypothetical protein